MEGTSPTQLQSPQLCSTVAEAKACRMNRREQSRLDSTHSYLSRQERYVHKDFKTSRIKVQNHFNRRLSSYEGGVGSSNEAAFPFSWPPTNSVSVSQRRASEFPPSSCGRLSVWSLRGAMAREGHQKRRKTYGGPSMDLPLQPAFGAGGRCACGAGHEMPVCPICNQVPGVIKPHLSPRGSLHGQQLNQLKETPFDQEINRRTSVCHPPGSAADHTLAPGFGGGRLSSLDIPVITFDNIPTTASDDECEERKLKCLPCPKTASADHVRRVSSVTLPLNGENQEKAVASKIRRRTVGGVTHLLKEEANCNGDSEETLMSSVIKDSVSCSRTIRKASKSAPTKISLPLVRHATSFSSSLLQTCATNKQNTNQSSNQHLPVNGSQSPRRKSSVGSDISRKTSVSFVHLPSQPSPKPMLQEKVVRFLEQQVEFNKRFPLQRHIVKSLECVRPDLLHMGQGRRQPERKACKEKARMIAEVLGILGLERTEYDVSN